MSQPRLGQDANQQTHVVREGSLHDKLFVIESPEEGSDFQALERGGLVLASDEGGDVVLVEGEKGFEEAAADQASADKQEGSARGMRHEFFLRKVSGGSKVNSSESLLT